LKSHLLVLQAKVDAEVPEATIIVDLGPKECPQFNPTTVNLSFFGPLSKKLYLVTVGVEWMFYTCVVGWLGTDCHYDKINSRFSSLHELGDFCVVVFRI
jgi:hypothetical protein